MTDRRVAHPPVPGRAGLEEASLQKIVLGDGSRSARDGAAPLSYAQRRLWILDQIEPGIPLANIPRAFRIRGWLDVEALRRALETIRERHEVLRSVFRSMDGTLVQTVAASPSDSLPIVDLSVYSEADREAEVLRLAGGEAQTPFDLTQGPMLRTRLLRLSIEEHVLLITSHQIVFDERSAEIFDRELGVLYDAYFEGKPSPLEPLPIQYRDFSMWQTEFLKGRAFEEQLAYWKRQLRGAPPPLDLPASRRRPQESTFRGATERAALSRELLEAIRDFAANEGVSPFVTLLAAFQVLLLRHSGRSDFAVGSLVTGRRETDFEGLIGLFANSLVFRADLSGDPSFRELLGRVRKVAVEAEANQDVPFERLVDELNPERTLSHPPLFQVTLALQQGSRAPLRLSGVSVAPLSVTAEIARHELALSFTSEGEEGWASLQYKTDLFESRTIRRLLAHLEGLLRGVVTDPSRRLSQLPLMAPGEQLQVLVGWNQTAIEYSRDVTVVRLFEDQAARTPDRVAIELDGRTLTYKELNQRSNRLARHLRRLGIVQESLVGLCLDRSPEMILALLAILKAGGAYVPLDPNYPRERLRYMVEDSGAGLVLIDRASAGKLGPVSGRDIRLDVALSESASERSDNDADGVAPSHLAYIIYTSGSTGTPKGVEIEHRSLANYIQFAADLFALSVGDRVLQFASLSFDAAAEEIFTTLTRGATLVLRPGRMIASVADFLARSRDLGLTVLVLPTAYWHELVTVAAAEHLRLSESVRLTVIGGERALPERLAQWSEVAGDSVRLLNAYGPSEATVSATFWEATRDGAESSRRAVPIGRPVSNTRLYVLDANLQPVPIGVVGELYVAGVALARGYRGRPELTAERFVETVFPGVGRERIYRTGDRVRYRSDGDLEYMGRADEQVKLRGLRIEPREVETALRAHPAVREAVVVSSGDGEGQCLVAFLVASPQGMPTASDLRALLKKTLPEFMIPSKFVALNALPLTPSGKLDRKVLSEADAEKPTQAREYVAPQDIVEVKLARLWAQVLKLERVGIDDDFFELGGHSLLAVRLLSQVEKTFERQLPLTVIFDAPTVRQLAALLQKEGWSPSWSALVPIQVDGWKPPLFIVHALGGNVLTYKHIARHLGPDQPVYGLQAQGLDGKQPPLTRVEDIATRYVETVREFQPEGPYWLAGYSFGGMVAFDMARQLQGVGMRVPLVALLDADNLPPPPPPEDSSVIVRNVRRIGRRVGFHFKELGHLAPRARYGYLAEKARIAFGWLTASIETRYRSVRHPLPEAIRIVNAAHQLAADTYKAQPYDGRVVLLRASERRSTSPGIPDLGWEPVCQGVFEIIEVPGDHDVLVEEPQVAGLVRELEAKLCEVRQAEAGSAGIGEPGAGEAESTFGR